MTPPSAPTSTSTLERTIAPADRHRLPVRKLVAASIGNAIEWYDWTIYATFSTYIANALFAPDSKGLIATFATFALAFLFRPLGGLLIGRFADVRGRRPAMILTIVLMAGGSLAIGLVPAFAVAGWLAPVLLLLARIAQGLSLGGEVSNASAYLGEIAPPERRGRYSSFYYISTGIAVLVASMLGFVLVRVLDPAAMASYGWRIPFLVGGVLGILGLWLRSSLTETDHFERNKQKARAVRRPLLTTLRRHPRAVGQLVGISMLATLCYYTFFVTLTPFAINARGAAPQDVFLALSIGTVVFIALQYPLGAISDRYGRKPQLLAWAGATAVLIVPLSTLVTADLASLVLVFTAGLAIYTALTSISPAVMSELLPTEVRALGIGAWNNVTVAIFGGTAPLVNTALAGAGLGHLFFWYVAAGAVVGFLVIRTLPETRGRDLD